jgi:lipooligosaccharide transport system permease protein
MNNANNLPMASGDRSPVVTPTRLQRVLSVWYRHWRVYNTSFVANATPAVLEPLFFQLAVGFGLGRYLNNDFYKGLDYATFMSPGILGMTAMYTAAFEATHATFVRMRYQKTYSAMLATPLTRSDIFWGELFWCSSKGILYATIVGLVLAAFGTILSPLALLIPIAGFFTAMTFAGISFLVTSRVKNINQFQYFFTAFLTPLVYVSGLMFPVEQLPYGLKWAAYSLPMFHVVETFRMIVSGADKVSVSWAPLCPLILTAMAFVFAWLGVKAMEKRVGV